MSTHPPPPPPKKKEKQKKEEKNRRKICLGESRVSKTFTETYMKEVMCGVQKTRNSQPTLPPFPSPILPPPPPRPYPPSQSQLPQYKLQRNAFKYDSAGTHTRKLPFVPYPPSQPKLPRYKLQRNAFKYDNAVTHTRKLPFVDNRCDLTYQLYCSKTGKKSVTESMIDDKNERKKNQCLVEKTTL